jgi:carbonic anhydrase
MISAQEALERLREGNRHFVSDTLDHKEDLAHSRRSELPREQAPFAIILGCSDSRVPAELVFDQGLGDLFVIRVAGNIAAPSQIGSIEFAAERFGTRLVVVLGHNRCGAIAATLEALRGPELELSPNLLAIVDRVRPCVEPLLHCELGDDETALAGHAVRVNVDTTVARLQSESELIARLVRDEGLRVVGAEYSLDSGEVSFYDADEVG